MIREDAIHRANEDSVSLADLLGVHNILYDHLLPVVWQGDRWVLVSWVACLGFALGGLVAGFYFLVWWLAYVAGRVSWAVASVTSGLLIELWRAREERAVVAWFNIMFPRRSRSRAIAVYLLHDLGWSGGQLGHFRGFPYVSQSLCCELRTATSEEWLARAKIA